MLARKHRFHGHNSLRYTYNEGATIRGPLMALKYVRNKKRKDYRVSVVVSKKVHKSAFVRNRIRRRLYEIVRRQEQGIVEPYDMVITVFHDTVAELPADELQKSLVWQLKKAGIVSRKNPTKAHLASDVL